MAKSVLSKSGVRVTEEGLKPGKLAGKEVVELTEELAKQQYVKVSPPPSIDAKFQSDLESSNISEELRKEFENIGFSLSDNARVSGDTWQINDEGKTYIVKKERDKLNVYPV